MFFFRKKTELTDISGIKAKRIVTQVPLGQHYLLGMDNWVGNSRILVVGNPENGRTHNVMAGALLQGDKSYIVNDLNGELYEMCGSALKKLGYKVELLDFDALEKSDTYYNPFLYIKSDDEYKRDVYAFCHQALIDKIESGDSKKYVTMCQLMLSIVLYMAYECNEERLKWCTFFDLLEMADEETGDGRNQLEVLFELADLQSKRKQGESDATNYLTMYRRYMNTVHTSGIQLDAVSELKKLFTYALPYAQQEKAAIITASQIDFADFLNEKVALFVKAGKDSAKLLPIFYSQSHWNLFELRYEKDKQNCDSVGTKNKLNGLPVMYLLDNFTDIGKVELLYFFGSNRDDGLCYMISVRSLSQLENVYSDDFGLETILGSCWTKIYLYGNGEEMKKHYSYEKLPIPQNPGDEVILYYGKEPLRDKVYDIDKRLEELK